MYEKFIKKYRNQIIPYNIYTEYHHIIPKYLGGSNKEVNLIRLTYRQHILAHLLLYRKYGNIEDLTAYKLMTGLSIDRKRIISKMIGERHKRSGHIYRLGKKNRDTGFLLSVRSFESCSKGGKIAGAIAKESGQILTIQTEESLKKGGIIAGNIAKKKGQIQKLGQYKGEYVLIMPDGTEFQHTFQAMRYMKLDKKLINSRCKNNHKGFSRRKKTIEELDNRWTDME